MIIHPETQQQIPLKQWWIESKLNYLLEWQAKYVANNVSKHNSVKKDKKYKQSEKLIRKCGFYDRYTVSEA